MTLVFAHTQDLSGQRETIVREQEGRQINLWSACTLMCTFVCVGGCRKIKTRLQVSLAGGVSVCVEV